MLQLAPPTHHFEGDHYGVALCVVGDVDRDGVGDFAVGDASFATQHTLVDLRSGATGKVIWRIATATIDANNPRVSAAGDLDGDGVPDVLLGTSQWTRPEAEEGVVRVLSGWDGHVLHVLHSSNMDSSFGIQLAGNVDFDADGVPDIVVNAASKHTADRRIAIHSGHDGHLLRSIECLSESFACGADFDGDGSPDIV